MIRSQLTAFEPRSEDQPGFYSCFLSYASADDKFVRRLVSDLRSAGIPCWLDRNDMPIGGHISQELHRGLAGQDKVLLVLSKNSIGSPWVQKELQQATELERERRRDVLFPIRIDDSVFASPNSWVRELVGERHIGDFTNWDDDADYRRSLRRLTRDLTFGAAHGTSSVTGD